MIISLEGNVYSGKTSIAKEVSKKIHADLIGEYSEFLNKGVDKVVRGNYLEIQKKYLEADVKRKKEVLEGRDYILDRSFVSPTAHVWALFRLGIADIREEYYHYFAAMADSCKLIIPDRFVFLACSFERAKERYENMHMSDSKGTGKYLIDEAYFREVDAFCRRFCKIVGGIVVDNSSSGTGNAAKKIIGYAQNEKAQHIDTKEIKKAVFTCLEI